MKIKLCLLFLLFLHSGTSALADSLTNVVQLTPDLNFYLRKDKGGIATQFKADELVFTTLLVPGTNIPGPYGIPAAGTNIVYYRALPSWAQWYDFKLFDALGKEVPKTSEGRTYSKPATAPKGVLDLYYHFRFQVIKAADTRGLFRPEEMFVITNKGIYRMEVRRRICVPMTNGVPDTNAMEDAHRFGAAEHFGIVESPPVHATVIKE